jgi:hypothetical protein
MPQAGLAARRPFGAPPCSQAAVTEYRPLVVLSPLPRLVLAEYTGLISVPVLSNLGDRFGEPFDTHAQTHRCRKLEDEWPACKR